MDDFFMNKRIVDERKKRHAVEKQQLSKKRLKDDVKKKIKTTMIGALASFEKGFGDLMGLEKDEESLSANQKKLQDIWYNVREEILDRGNLQIHSILDEIDNYNITWDGYNYNFIIKGNQ